MSKTGRFSTHHVPDEGTWYVPGEIVRLDQSARQVQIIKDPHGEYEVQSCRYATEYAGSVPPLLRVGLRKSSASSAADGADPPSRPRPYAI
jgi:hypothetical protein